MCSHFQTLPSPPQPGHALQRLRSAKGSAATGRAEGAILGLAMFLLSFVEINVDPGLGRGCFGVWALTEQFFNTVLKDTK